MVSKAPADVAPVEASEPAEVTAAPTEIATSGAAAEPVSALLLSPVASSVSVTIEEEVSIELLSSFCEGLHHILCLWPIAYCEHHDVEFPQPNRSYPEFWFPLSVRR